VNAAAFLPEPAVLLADPSATGAGIRVAIIDTGVDAETLACRHGEHTIERLRFLPDRLVPTPVIGPPSNLHGTTVADILLSQAPGVTLYSADVFGARGTCEVEPLLRAIRHALDVWKCRVINLSLGIAEAQLIQVPRRLALQRIVEEAYFREVMIVAAAGNDEPIGRNYPAAFGPSLFGVALHTGSDPGDIRYRPGERIEFAAPGRGGHGPLGRLASTSWAAPHVSAAIARLLSAMPNLRPFEVKTLLARLSAARPARDLRPEPRTC